MPTRREILLSSAALTSLLLLPGARPAQAAVPRRGGTLIANTVPEPNGLVSGLTPSNPAVVVSTNLFDGLITYDRENQPIPQLAESWQTTDDGHTITSSRNGYGAATSRSCAIRTTGRRASPMWTSWSSGSFRTRARAKPRSRPAKCTIRR
jgi:hypothetical protein